MPALEAFSCCIVSPLFLFSFLLPSPFYTPSRCGLLVFILILNCVQHLLVSSEFSSVQKRSVCFSVWREKYTSATKAIQPSIHCMSPFLDQSCGSIEAASLFSHFPPHSANSRWKIRPTSITTPSFSQPLHTNIKWENYNPTPVL
jgi:hypothetical protein